MQQGPGGVRGDGGGGAGQRRRTAWILASRGEAKRRSLCGDQLGQNCARRSTMELCAWALEFLVILVINN